MAAEGKDKAGEIDAAAPSPRGQARTAAPRGRTFEAFVKESDAHGWPSFRDEEVNWDDADATLEDGDARLDRPRRHLGHNLPDRNGRRYASPSWSPSRAARARARAQAR